MGHESAATVENIKYRMKTLGIDMDAYIGSITDHWDSTPQGFKFTCKDRKGLMMALIQNAQFAADTSLGGKMHQGVSWREVSKSNSLHIIVRKGHATKGQSAVDTGTIHLDSVSVVAGRNPQTRGCLYDYGAVLQHVATDLKHARFIVPTSAGGLVVCIH